MDSVSENREKYLLIDNTPSIDAEILAVLLDDASTAVDTAQSHRSALKKLQSKSYDCLVLPVADSTDRQLSWVGSTTAQRPLVILIDEIEQPLPDWTVWESDVHVLYHDSDNLKRIAGQIHGISDGAERRTHLERHTKLRHTIWDIVSAYPTADSRTELERITCDQFVASDLYQTAWTSVYTQTELIPSVASGINRQSVVSLSASDLPGEDVYVTDSGHSITIPLSRDELIGTLTLTTARRIDDAERELLGEFGETLTSTIQRVTEDHSIPREVDTYMRSFSHELRNQLQSAKAELHAEGDSDRVHAILDRIERLDREVVLLTKESLDETTCSTYPLSEIVEDVLTRMPKLGDRVSSLTSKSVYASRPLIELLFENLFRNTRDHAGIDAQIRVGALDDGFFVEDTGHGLPDVVPDSLFEWGYSVDGNTGRGLAIVKRIATLHGWDIESTESAEGGTRFEFTGAQSPVGVPVDQKST